MQRFIRLVMLIGVLGMAMIAAISWTVWSGRDAISIQSEPLAETRKLIVYNDRGQADAPVIIVLDGEKLRHGLATAVQARLMSWLMWQSAPIVIAVDGMGNCETDFRNPRSAPARWRPSIAGRAPQFDKFLLHEVFPLAEEITAKPQGIYLFGHSLGGLYAIDFSTRHAEVRNYAGFAAFSPTFSHDLSVVDRLPQLCDKDLSGLAIIGTESGRDTKVFRTAQSRLRTTPACRNGAIQTADHPGVIYQIVMLTGQTQALVNIAGR